MKVAFVGLGNMGGPMASNLARAGHAVTGYDISAPAPGGVLPADSIASAVDGQEIVFAMLPGRRGLPEACPGIFTACQPGTCIVDCSAVTIPAAREMHILAGRAGCLSLDAPVSGGVPDAQAATLTFMAGGSEQAFRLAAPLLGKMGQRAIHCGPAGAGQATRFCNSMILGASMAAVCETMNMARKLDLDLRTVFDVISTSSGACWSLNSHCPEPGIGPPSPADDHYRPYLSAGMMLKDLQLAQQAATEAGVPTPMGERATELYRAFVEQGGTDRDFSALILWLRAMPRP